jgi:DNA invertase Pin-like site-specific DNA recombinase
MSSVSESAVDDGETLLTREYLNSIIEAARRNEHNGGLVTAAMLANVILQETDIWKRDEVVNLYESGHSTDAISEQCGISTQTVRKWLRNAGVEIRPVGRPVGWKKPKKE